MHRKMKKIQVQEAEKIQVSATASGMGQNTYTGINLLSLY